MSTGGVSVRTHNLILSTSFLGEPLLRAVIELGGARALVSRHFLRVLKRAAIGEVGGDTGCTERVAADFRRDPGRRRTPAGQASGWLMGLSDNVLPLCPRAVRNRDGKRLES